MKIAALALSPLEVPLLEPFVIANAAMTATRAVLVRVVAASARGAGAVRLEGLGEAAALYPVTSEDQPGVLAALAAAEPRIVGAELSGPDDVARLCGSLGSGSLGLGPVAASGLECALLDALAKGEGVPLHRLLAPGRAGEAGAGEATLHEAGAGEPCARELVTDITLPIAEPQHLAELARGYRERGFQAFKVKVGSSLARDREMLAALARAVPDARVRLDANEGFEAREAILLAEAALKLGLALDCFEQPCRKDDLAGMAEVVASDLAPVVADESVRSLADVDALIAARAADAVNLKLAKLGGLLPALAVGRRARAAGLRLMAGAMVETRLGLAAMAQLVVALGGVDWVDLDTAFLLADDPFTGGYAAHGPRLVVGAAAGHGCSLASS